jgi:hypothetical protein
MNDPAWAYEQMGKGGYNHLWTFLRRKATLSISAETAQLPRDLDKISLIRQTDSPSKLVYVPDEIFYRYIPNPTATGSPFYYRLWEEEGVSTRLAEADTIDIISSSTSDTSTYKISIVGYNSNGYIQSEELNLNGTTLVNGTNTYVANKPLRISKSAKTTGYITVTEHSGGTTLVVLGPEERTVRAKVIGIYPIVTTATSLYLEYYTRIRMLENDTDVPDIDEKWIWVVRLGTMAKVYQYQNKESLFNTTQAMYAAGVKSMIKADMQEPDYLPHFKNHNIPHGGIVEFGEATYGTKFGINF